MAGTPFLSEIRIMSFSFPPKGWARCDGQILPINQNQALFSLLGTNYGGDGRVNFGLPDLRGRASMHIGNGHTLAERAGEQNHTLIISELPQHSHRAIASSDGPSVTLPTNNFWSSNTGFTPYGITGDVAMSPQSFPVNTGGSQAHSNTQPFLTLNFCIALLGIFP